VDVVRTLAKLRGIEAEKVASAAVSNYDELFAP
jgi:Tat protein secretion system quality control protein TatD with DNase activity